MSHDRQKLLTSIRLQRLPCGESLPSAASAAGAEISLRLASGQKPGWMQMPMCEGRGGAAGELDTGWRSTSPGFCGPRLSGGRSPWRTSAGYATSVTGERHGSIGRLQGTSGTARWTGAGRSGPGGATEGGPMSSWGLWGWSRLTGIERLGLGSGAARRC